MEDARKRFRFRIAPTRILQTLSREGHRNNVLWGGETEPKRPDQSWWVVLRKHRNMKDA